MPLNGHLLRHDDVADAAATTAMSILSALWQRRLDENNLFKLGGIENPVPGISPSPVHNSFSITDKSFIDFTLRSDYRRGLIALSGGIRLLFQFIDPTQLKHEGINGFLFYLYW